MNKKEKVENEKIKYKDREFILAKRGNKKTILFLLNDEDKKRLEKAKKNPYYRFLEQNKKILKEYLSDEDFVSIIKLKFWGFEDLMFGYSIDADSVILYNSICIINNFTDYIAK